MPLNLVIIIQRTDITNKSGGDLIQFLQVKHFLELQDFKVSLMAWEPQLELSQFDIVNLVNDRPLIIADSIRILNKLNHRPGLVISPIHHSDHELLRLRKFGFAESSFELLASKLLKIRVFEKILYHWMNIVADLRMISSTHSSWTAICTLIRNFSNIYSRKKFASILKLASAFQFLAVGEKKSFVEDYRISNDELTACYVIPNGKPHFISYPKSNSEWIEFPIIVIGRIEPRKRSLELARLANELKIQITFVGAIGRKESRYVNQFLREVAKSDIVNYLGAKSHSESVEIMGRSRVLLNASYSEVLSLVEIEAAVQGKFIVSSEVGYSNEYITNGQFVTYPWNNLRVGLETASKLANSEITQFNTLDIPFWSVVANRYSDMYRELFGRI